MSGILPPTHAQRQSRFGRIKFTPHPSAGNPEAVRIDSDWKHHNLVEVHCPQLRRLGLVKGSVGITMHGKVSKPFLALWQAWEDAGHLELIHSFNGMWVTRFKRQSGTIEQRIEKCTKLGAASLSNHSWGTAFDINAREWPLGKACPPDHVYAQLFPIAEEHGFFPGARFRNRPDPMHFEYAAP
jgi:hypothetical protein